MPGAKKGHGAVPQIPMVYPIVHRKSTQRRVFRVGPRRIANAIAGDSRFFTLVAETVAQALAALGDVG